MIEEGTAGDIWFVPDDEYDRLSLYDSHANKWEVTPQYCTSLAANAHTLFIGQGGRISSLLGGNDEGPPGLSYLNFEDGQWRDLKQVPELPRYTVTTLAPAGDNLWVGGVGYVALIDVQENKVIKFAYIPAGSVEQIELAGGYLWTLFNGYLHRTPLPGGE
jgi:hypothetical protein